MAFKKLKDYNEEKFGNWFLLRNDGDSADVIFLYQSIDDVLVADTHYVKSADYSGYVQCVGANCPACANKLRVQTKLFIPLYNITNGQVEFWDRSVRFEPQFEEDVFKNFSNPSEYVFKITRHGAAGDVNTRYSISALAKNTYKSYAQILADNKISFPEYYETICRDVPSSKLYDMLNTTYTAKDASDLADYTPAPRVAVPEIPNMKEDDEISETYIPSSAPDLGKDAMPWEDTDADDDELPEATF